MFPGSNSSFQSELYQNIPNMALMFTMYSPMFGNGTFVVQPAGPGEVQPGFPTVPYMPLEALIYQQQASNPQTAPVNVIGGSNTGEQVISGNFSAQDNTGTTRYQIGYQSS